MNPFLDFVTSLETGIKHAATLSVDGQGQSLISQHKALLCSPHPDDECITGLLPLRLMREANVQIVNIPVTFGSDPERRTARAQELQAACSYLGWSNHRPDGTNALGADDLLAIFLDVQPAIIFVPHANDWNSRHLETNRLVMEALNRMPQDFHCLLMETEFWHPLDEPNLMVEGDARTVADLVAATSLHKGEVERNPYHLLLPAGMQDAVRRGTERVGGQGTGAPDFSFASLYRLRYWSGGGLLDTKPEAGMIPMKPDAIMEILPWKS